jgi:hypothetical protein
MTDADITCSFCGGHEHLETRLLLFNMRVCTDCFRLFHQSKTTFGNGCSRAEELFMTEIHKLFHDIAKAYKGAPTRRLLNTYKAKLARAEEEKKREEVEEQRRQEIRAPLLKTLGRLSECCEIDEEKAVVELNEFIREHPEYNTEESAE